MSEDEGFKLACVELLSGGPLESGGDVTVTSRDGTAVSLNVADGESVFYCNLCNPNTAKTDKSEWLK